ncbi:MAG: alpha/beta hydrolase [Acidimicrobiales bacterium]|nr:alpha/beta hydrolase [Acidimicrobiales bacterium]MCB9395056.1 alpha/beta hydrolase [Acidimicrobiaceae bacterium]
MSTPLHSRVTCTGANGVGLVADAYGHPDDPAVLLLHGGGQTRHSWGGTAATLARTGFYAVSADLRGHGDSDWDPEGHYGLDAFRVDTEAWCALLGRPVVVGASMGGMAGLWTEGTRARDGLEPAGRALVMVDIAHRTEPDGVARIISFMTGRPEGFATLDEAADAIAEYLPHRPRPTNLDGLARNLRLGDDGRYHWHWDPAFMDPDRPRTSNAGDTFADLARLLRIPVLVVRGRMSDVLSEEAAQEFLTLVPHARYVDVGDAHHMVAGDKNDSFTTAVVEFLGEIR